MKKLIEKELKNNGVQLKEGVSVINHEYSDRSVRIAMAPGTISFGHGTSIPLYSYEEVVSYLSSWKFIK